MTRAVILCSLWLLSASAARADDSAVERAQRAFQVCVACHHERADATGPDLRTVLNRRAGTVSGFRYSPAMKRSNLVWTIDNLRAFLRNPQALVRGNRMPFSGVSDPAQIEDVLQYLSSLPH